MGFICTWASPIHMPVSIRISFKLMGVNHYSVDYERFIFYKIIMHTSEA